MVETPCGSHLRRNRKDLLATPEKFDVEVEDDVSSSPTVSVPADIPVRRQDVQQQDDAKHYITRSGRVSRPPSRYVP